MVKGLVSIIIPMYNAEKFIEDTINTVIEQTYNNWELILVNDKSKDNTIKIVNKFLSDKIKLVELEKNSGPAVARNKGIEVAKGEYITFLDADDLWKKEKLEKQIEYMNNNKECSFLYTSYEFISSDKKKTGKIAKVPLKITYNQALKNTTIFTSIVMFNMNKLNKEDILMLNVKSEDTATWWKILKKIEKAYGIDDVLVYYRRSSGTLSANKLYAMKKTWNLYRKVENLNIIKSSYCFICYALNDIKRRI